jgi:Quinohemoprotein amine dehydrogenase A, alpha subunit, haem binding
LSKSNPDNFPIKDPKRTNETYPNWVPRNNFLPKEYSMNKQPLTITFAILLVVLIGTLVVSCGTSNTPAPLDGQTLMQERCSVCHSLDRVTSVGKTADQWTVSVDRMVARGAQLNSLEQQTLIAYLAANYK